VCAKHLAQTKDQDVEKLKHMLDCLQEQLFFADENGLFKDEGGSDKYNDIIETIDKSLRSLSNNQNYEARKHYSHANSKFNNAINSTKFWWRFKYSYGGPILLYLLILLFFIFLAWISFSPALMNYKILWVPAWAYLWGSTGGILQGFWRLWQHVCYEGLRKVYFIWYIILPLAGAILGALTYLVFLAGFIVATGGTQITSESFVILICALAGFSSEWAVRILNNLTDMIQVGVKEKPST